MKSVVLFLFGVILFSSCGSDKKSHGETDKAAEQANFSIVFQGLYEKDDEIIVQYKIKDGYLDYDNPIKLKVDGQPNMQQMIVTIPQGQHLANFQCFVSTNKEQKSIQLKNISIQNNGKDVFNGDNHSYMSYFDGNPGLIFDEITKEFTLDFSGKYPPGYTGNDALENKLLQ